MLAVMPIGPGVADYQDTISYRVTAIDPGGCASARSEHSVFLGVNYNTNADATALKRKDHRARK
jgi:hypothetical protein